MKRKIALVLFVVLGLSAALGIHRYVITKDYSGWNHIVDPARIKFEMDYPDFLTFGWQWDMYQDGSKIYNVTFGEEVQIASAPGSEDDLRSLLSFSSEPIIYSSKIKIDGYDAIKINDPIYDKRVPPSYTVYFLANGRLYRIHFLKPELGHDKRMLESFRVIK